MISDLSEKYEKVVKACSYILHNESVAADVREKVNERTCLAYQESFDIGYFPDNKNINILESLVDKDLLEELNLVYPVYESGAQRAQGYFRYHNIVLPFRNAFGDIISILGRSPLSKEELTELGVDKYKYSLYSNKDLYVFGLDKAKESILKKGYLIGVEGQFDCIKCHEKGLTNVVAFGWANITRFQFFQIRKYTKNIYLMMDNDNAGERAKKKIKRIYNQYGNIKTISVPNRQYKDIDECLKYSDEYSQMKIINWLSNLQEAGG